MLTTSTRILRRDKSYSFEFLTRFLFLFISGCLLGWHGPKAKLQQSVEEGSVVSTATWGASRFAMRMVDWIMDSSVRAERTHMPTCVLPVQYSWHHSRHFNVPYSTQTDTGTHSLRLKPTQQTDTTHTKLTKSHTTYIQKQTHTHSDTQHRQTDMAIYFHFF